MRPSNKSRSRNKNNNRRSNQGANVPNRVFDSSGPSGKVRGTPQQIVDKYDGLASDAHLSGDRVAAENFMQHSEHYSRMLAKAMKEQAERQAEQQKQQQQKQQQGQQQQQSQQQQKKPAADTQADPASVEQPPMAAIETAPDNVDLVETPENKPASVPKRRARPKQAAPASIETASEAAPAD